MRGRVVLLAAMLALGAGGLSAPAPAAAEMAIRIGNAGEPETLDPHVAVGIPDGRILNELCEGLVSATADNTLIPGAAERWTVSPDGRTYTFHLRKDGRWSDGSSVTAEDWVWSWRRALAPATRPVFPDLLFTIENAVAIAKGEAPPDSLGVRAVDPYTLEVRLIRPDPEFIYGLDNRGTFVVKRAAIEKHGAEWIRPGNHVCNGPFMLAEYVPQAHVKLVRNPHFREASQVRLDAVYFMAIEDQNTELKAFRAGALDVTNSVPPSQIDWVRANLKDSLRIVPYVATYYYYPNFDREPWKSNQDLRMALSLAIDRQAIVDKIAKGGQVPAYTLVPTAIPGYRPPLPEWASWTQEQRVAEARRLVAKAGYGPGGKPLAFEMLFNTSELHRQIAIAMASMWQQALGAKVTLVNTEFRVLLARMANRDFPDLIRRTWVWDRPVKHLENFRDPSRRSSTGFDDPEYNRLLAEAETSLDPGVYDALLAKAEAVAVARAAFIPIFHDTTRRLVSPKVKGWVDNAEDTHLLRYVWMEP